MTKLSVGATIRDAYRFTFEHLGAIIGLIWLPMIILTVLGFFVQQRYYEALANAFASGNYASLGPAVLGRFFYMVAAILLGSMMAVPVMQLALGTRKTGSLAHFAFGAAEWRMFKTAIGLAAFLLIPLFIIAAAASLLLSSPAMAMLRVGAGMQALSLLFYACLVYFGVRFGFLLPAIVVAEEKPVLVRGWLLSRGNFWRMLAVLMGVLGPLLLVVLAVEWPVLSAMASVSLSSHGAVSPAMTAAILHSMSQNMPLTSGVGFLLAPLALGQALGAAGSAFRVLSGKTTISS